MVVFGRDRIKVCFEDRLTKWRGGGIIRMIWVVYICVGFFSGTLDWDVFLLCLMKIFELV